MQIYLIGFITKYFEIPVDLINLLEVLGHIVK